MKRLISYFEIFILVNIVMVSTVLGANTYVRPDGSDSICNGSTDASSASKPNCAYSSVRKAASIAAAGDIIIIHSGNYSETVTFSKSGSPAAPITFKGLGSPVIKGNVFIKGSYNIIDGLTVSPPSAGGYGAITLLGQHNLLSNCLVTNYGATADDQATAIIFDSEGSYNAVVGCTIRDLDDIDAFHVFGHDHVLRNNYVTRLNQVNYSLNHTDFFQTWGWAGSSTYNILVEGNVVTNSTAQLGNTSNDGYTALHDITFRNNIFANIGAAFFTGVPNTKFYNNVFYNCGAAQGYAVSYYNQTGYNSAGTEFKNNVFLNNIADINNHSGVANVTISNNYFAGVNYSAKRDTPDMGTNFINGGEAKFLNLNSLDFHIQPGSVLIGKGADLSSVFNSDKDGISRSERWDIGPYHFNGGLPNPPVLSAPKNLHLLSPSSK